MKKSKIQRKLALTKETIVNLNSEESGKLRGGADKYLYTSSPVACICNTGKLCFTNDLNCTGPLYCN